MSRTVTILFMTGLLLLAGLVAFLAGRRPPVPLTGVTGADATTQVPSRIGRSALSHGGPPPTSDTSAFRHTNEGGRLMPGESKDPPVAETAGTEDGRP